MTDRQDLIAWLEEDDTPFQFVLEPDASAAQVPGLVVKAWTLKQGIRHEEG